MSRFYHLDALGSTRGLTDAGQNPTDALNFDAFGMTASRTGTTPTPFGFVGKAGYQTDSDSGLMLLGHRYYDPSIGRFLTSDPKQDGDNWYRYVGNDPLGKTDPEGLSEDPGGSNTDTIRLSWTAFIPVKYPGLDLLGDYRDYSPNSSRYRLEQDIILNLRTHEVHILAGKVGFSHYADGSYAGQASNDRMFGYGSYSASGYQITIGAAVSVPVG